MKARKRLTQDLRAVCAVIHDDDGVDSREAFSRDDKSRNKQNRKVLQLCRQAYRVIDATLAGECADALLQDLQVLSVEPAPDASHLLVTVQVTTAGAAASLEAIHARLEHVRGFLRSEVARAVSRKRAPQLAFCVLTREQVGP